MSTFSDGGQRVSTCPRSKAQAFLPCENDQAKPDLFSRLARSTNCQRSLRSFHLSGVLLDRGPDCYIQVVLELVALIECATYCTLRRFCANFLNLSNFHSPVKLNLFLYLRPFKLIVCGRSSQVTPDWPWNGKFHSKASRCAKYQTSTGKNSPEPLRLTGNKSLGPAMACSLRVSLQRPRGSCLT